MLTCAKFCFKVYHHILFCFLLHFSEKKERKEISLKLVSCLGHSLGDLTRTYLIEKFKCTNGKTQDFLFKIVTFHCIAWIVSGLEISKTTYPKKKLTTPSKSWPAHYLLVQRDALLVSEQIHRGEMERRPLWTARLAAHAPALDFIWARTKCPRSSRKRFSNISSLLLLSLVAHHPWPFLFSSLVKAILLQWDTFSFPPFLCWICKRNTG